MITESLHNVDFSNPTSETNRNMKNSSSIPTIEGDSKRLAKTNKAIDENNEQNIKKKILDNRESTDKSYFRSKNCCLYQ